MIKPIFNFSPLQDPCTAGCTLVARALPLVPRSRSSWAVWTAGGTLALAALFPVLARAQVGLIEPEEGYNFVSLGLGSTPDYIGSNDRKTAVAPAARYYFSGQQYVQLLGPQLSLNLLNHSTYQFGPQILVRLKRDGGVKDPIVSRMQTIGAQAELGVFAAASWKLSEDPRNRFGIRGDVQSGSKGAEGTLTANFFVPVSRAVVLNLGGGVGFANDKWAKTYFGVDGTDLTLFPALTGNRYAPQGGFYDVRANFGAIVHLSPTWHLGMGARYQHLSGDFAGSPLVAQQGSRNQWIYGVALGYAWK